MKKFRNIIIIMALLAFIPASGFALADFGVYGGLTFASEVQPDESGAESYKISGLEYGFIGHYNTNIIPILLTLGVGAYVQYSPLKTGEIEYPTSTGGTDKEKFDFKKKTVGLDAYLQANVLFLHPFVRAGVGVWEGVDGQKVDGNEIIEENNEYFKSYYFGVGLAVNLGIPFAQAYAEYLYNTSKTGDADVKTNSFHLGVRVSI